MSAQIFKDENCSVCNAEASASLKCEDGLFYRQCSACGSDYAGPLETRLNKMLAQDQQRPKYVANESPAANHVPQDAKQTAETLETIKNVMAIRGYTVQKAWRYYMGMKQQHVANAFKCSITKASRIENTHSLKVREVEILAKLFDIAPYYLTTHKY